MRHIMSKIKTIVGFALVILSTLRLSAAEPDKTNPLFAVLTAANTPTLVTYTPSQLDPRQEVNQRRLLTSSIRADLVALRPAFDGLVLYGYHEACTPRILAIARDLKFRVVLLAIWDPKSTAEIDGVAELARQYETELACGVLVGNEGLTFKRYEMEDLTIAAARLKLKLSKSVPLGTSEPLVGYQQEQVVQFGDFLCPNIHPVFDRSEAAATDATAWARERASELATRSGKPVILKETGFPHAGKDMYSPATQQAFWTNYVKPGLLVRPPKASSWVFHGVAFEAFDLPWKSEESKLGIEKSWGVMSQAREPYPAFQAWKELRASLDAKR
jgi:exo-beta-1,3-glucanase (GH17 family)